MGDIPKGVQITGILGIMVPIIFIIVIGVVHYLKKRLEHKQIMAAIEKGIPLSELLPPKPQLAGPGWIRYASIGIMLPIISLGFLLGGRHETIIAFALIGVGAGWLVRGLLHRKYYLKSQSANQNDVPPDKVSA